MEDSLITIFSIILAVLLMFIFPIMDTWERQDDISYMSVYATVVEFVDSARNLGYITEDMYVSFLKSVYATGNRYEITMEHRKFQYVPNEESGASSNINSVYVNTYTNSIISQLNEKGRYDMAAGDYFYVSIKNTNKTQSTQIKEVVYASMQETFKIGVPYGGMVRNTSPNK